MTFNVSENTREKYSSIEITWWESLFDGMFDGNVWWLDEVISFTTGDDPVKKEINTQDEDTLVNLGPLESDNTEGLRIYNSHHYKLDFPKKGSYHASNGNSHAFVWGEEDNISISWGEFENAGGLIRVEYDTDDYKHYLVVYPPSEDIGVNSNFSLTMEGSVPGVVIHNLGVVYKKRVTTLYTSFYGTTTNTLELEFSHITNKNLIFTAAQKLLEKYSYGDLKFSLDYYEDSAPQLDQKSFVPQTVTVDHTGKRSTSDAFLYNRLDSIGNGFRLDTLGNPNVSLDHLRFYPLAYLR